VESQKASATAAGVALLRVLHQRVHPVSQTQKRERLAKAEIAVPAFEREPSVSI
jgi:hypothetical protein